MLESDQMKTCTQCEKYVARPIYHKHEDKWIALCWECYIYHIVGDRIELMPHDMNRVATQIAYSAWGLERVMKSFVEALKGLNRALEESNAFWRD
jgi:hypothetical protein